MKKTDTVIVLSMLRKLLKKERDSPPKLYAISKDLSEAQSAYEEGKQEGYLMGRRDGIAVAVEAINEVLS